MSLTVSEGAVVLRGGAYKAFGGVLIGFMWCLAIVPLVSDRVFANIVGALAILAFGTFWVRWVRAQVRAESAYLLLRSIFRTTRLDWAEVAEARVVPTNANNLVAILSITTVKGKRFRVDGVGNRWRGRCGKGPVYEMAAEINRRARVKHDPGRE